MKPRAPKVSDAAAITLKGSSTPSFHESRFCIPTYEAKEITCPNKSFFIVSCSTNPQKSNNSVKLLV